MSAAPAAAPAAAAAAAAPQVVHVTAGQEETPLNEKPVAVARSFKEKILKNEPVVVFSMCPPRINTPEDKMEALNGATVERVASLATAGAIDGLIVYDIHEEAERKPDVPRPFPHVDTLDGVKWMKPLLAHESIARTALSCVYYRCIVKHSKSQLASFIDEHRNDPRSSVVYVGAASSASPTTPLGVAGSQEEALTLRTAYEMHNAAVDTTHEFLVGAVAIPERHAVKKDEHLRMISKQKNGARYFVTQCVYSAELAKNMLSDYYYACKDEKLPVLPILFTIAPCGSLKTLEFLEWLGVEPAHWLKNDIKHSVADGRVLEESCEQLVDIARELVAFGRRKDINISFNVESVAIRKAEIDAAVALAAQMRKVVSA